MPTLTTMVVIKEVQSVKDIIFGIIQTTAINHPHPTLPQKFILLSELLTTNIVMNTYKKFFGYLI